MLRTTTALESNGRQTITPAMVREFAATAPWANTDHRRQLPPLAQRVEVVDGAVRIIGLKCNLLHTLAAASEQRYYPYLCLWNGPDWMLASPEGFEPSTLRLGI